MTKSRTLPAVLLAASLALCLGAVAYAGGGGHAGWTIDGVGSTEVSKGEKGARVLSYHYDVPSFESEQEWSFAKEAEQTGTLDVEWTLDGHHGWFMDWVELYAWADGPGGRTTQTLVATPHSEGTPGSIDGPFSFDGTVTLEVTAGYDFGFSVKGANFSFLGQLEGDLTVKERDQD